MNTVQSLKIIRTIADAAIEQSTYDLGKCATNEWIKAERKRIALLRRIHNGLVKLGINQNSPNETQTTRKEGEHPSESPLDS